MSSSYAMTALCFASRSPFRYIEGYLDGQKVGYDSLVLWRGGLTAPFCHNLKVHLIADLEREQDLDGSAATKKRECLHCALSVMMNMTHQNDSCCTQVSVTPGSSLQYRLVVPISSCRQLRKIKGKQSTTVASASCQLPPSWLRLQNKPISTKQAHIIH